MHACTCIEGAHGKYDGKVNKNNYVLVHDTNFCKSKSCIYIYIKACNCM